jgi:hypothetical protein
MDPEARVISAMKEFAEKYRVAGKYKKYAKCMEFIHEFEKSFFG